MKATITKIKATKRVSTTSKWISKVGAGAGDRLGMAFGTHAPFDYVGPSLIKLANVELLRPADHEAIAWKNAARFLALD